VCAPSISPRRAGRPGPLSPPRSRPVPASSPGRAERGTARGGGILGLLHLALGVPSETPIRPNERLLDGARLRPGLQPVKRRENWVGCRLDSLDLGHVRRKGTMAVPTLAANELYHVSEGEICEKRLR